MKRLRLYMLVFCLAVSMPMAYVTWQTYASLTMEELAQMDYFSDALFDELEKAMAELIQVEESRAVDEYHHTLIRDGSAPQPSPLARKPEHSYIVGYFQNNPDGTIQTPLVPDLQHVPTEMKAMVNALTEANRVFNQKKFSIPSLPSVADVELPSPIVQEEKKKVSTGLAERYFAKPSQTSSKVYLGKKEVRTEEITAQQALNIAPDEQRRSALKQDADHAMPTLESESPPRDNSGQMAMDASPSRIMAEDTRFEVEVAPFQSVFVSTEQVFVFRRIAIGNQIYRQGFVLDLPKFFNHLASGQFLNQPLSGFASLNMGAMNGDQYRTFLQFGSPVGKPLFSNQRLFPSPFNFVSATLQTGTIPRSPARRPLNLALLILATVMLIGLFAIYQSTRAIVAMSERRSQFVSSVTHELKTPLTNIRMYIEMIEQGIAASPEREQEYLKVLDAESARLSRLINNVLELAKLEKKQRNFQYQQGDLTDVFDEMKLIMSQKLQQEGFSLNIDASAIPIFSYDREVLIQLLVNLMENSIKFGNQSAQRQLTITARADNNDVHIAVSDTGPGIPRQAIKKVFNDFYRVDNELTRTTGGTGIGLALVKKFIDAMGGRVHASNNPGPGCTITLRLPRLPIQS